MDSSIERSTIDDTGKLTLSIVVSGVVMFVIIAVFIGGPRATPALLPLLAGLIYLRLSQIGRPRPTISLSPLLKTLGLFGIYLLVNASWSQLPLLAYGKVALYFAFIGAVTVGYAALKSSDRGFIERLSLNLILAVFVVTSLLAIEVWFGAPLRLAAAKLFPILLPAPKHVIMENDIAKSIAAYVLNRPVAAAALVLWPALLVTMTLFRRPLRWIVGAGIGAAMVFAVFSSEHATSMTALIFSVAIFVLAYWLPKTAIWSAGIGWTAATMLVIPIVFAAYAQKLHFSTAIPKNSRARIILWQYTAEQTFKHPFLGVGVQSTRPLDEGRTVPPEQPEGFIYPRKTSRHAHNIYLQSWYELGAVGAIFLWFSGLLLLRRIAALGRRARPFALASFVSAAVIGAFSWGLWQPWFMAAFAMAALLTNLAIELSQRRAADLSAQSSSA